MANNINHDGDMVGNYIDSIGTSYGFLRYHNTGQITTFGIPNAPYVFPNYRPGA